MFTPGETKIEPYSLPTNTATQSTKKDYNNISDMLSRKTSMHYYNDEHDFLSGANRRITTLDKMYTI